MDKTEDYQPIEDYGAIGNLRTVALAGRNGSIDWFCYPHLDSPSVFGAILDARQGGCFRIAPASGPSKGEQRYIDETNVLETWFDNADGRLTITDFLPLSGDIDGCGNSNAPSELFRIVRWDGEIDVELVWAPRFDYARTPTHIAREAGGYAAHGAGQRLTLLGVPDSETHIHRDESGQDTLFARFTLEHGDTNPILMSWDEGMDHSNTIAAAMDALERTINTWRNWARKEEATGDRSWAEPWHDLVMRSELALKMLTHSDTGAIAAAPTTSLPETIGGVRNWDYRYAWIRDAGMTGQAFVAMGHHAEMRDFVRWVERASDAHRMGNGKFEIMYSVHGNSHIPVTKLDHLEGYKGSRPVRIGNEAADQDQHDVLGELMDAAEELVAEGLELSDRIWKFLPVVADRAAEAWKEPDDGLWEMPLPPTHYVYSKLMTWVALDRAVSLAEKHQLRGDVERWRRARDDVRAMILERGYNDERGAFVQTLDSDVLDASALMMPVEGLLPFDDRRVRNTIDRIIEELTDNDLVRRYAVDDGLPGEEGGWVLCTTWLVDNLALSGRHEEAERIFERLAGRANHLGLFAEQIDPSTGAFLGNFPQAFSHIGVINSVVFLAHAKGREVPTAIPAMTSLRGS